MTAWIDRHNLEHWLRMMADVGDPVAEIRLGLTLVESRQLAEAEDARRVGRSGSESMIMVREAERSRDDAKIMMMLGETLRDAELVDREVAICRHLVSPAYRAERERCGAGHTHGQIDQDASLVTKRPRSPNRVPNARWNFCPRADAVLEHRYRQAAEQDDTQAMCSLADLFEFCGDLGEAQSWLRRAAHAGYEDAVTRENDIVARLDREAEMKGWYLRAAERGCTDAMLRLAELFELRGDNAEAERWIRRAADLGDRWAEFTLHDLLRRHGRDAEMESWYRQTAECGGTQAIRISAMWSMVKLEEHERRDIGQAEWWLRRLIDAGDDAALGRIGQLLRRQGRETEMEPTYRQWAIERGSTEAMERLACLSEDRGDLTEAARWMGLAMQAGDLGAANWLSNLLERHGHSLSEMQRWYRQAAQAGNTWAIFRLDETVEQFGCETETECWYREAAGSGYTYAMFGLGRLLDQRGDAEQAESWLRRAAEGGDDRAVSYLAMMLQRQERLAEAEPWLCKAAEIKEARGRGWVPHSAGEWVAAVVSAVITVAILPFVNALLTRAANETYEKIRSLLRRLVSRDHDEIQTWRLADQLIIVADPDLPLKITLYLWADTPDDALRALADLNMEELIRGTQDGRLRLFWDNGTRSWQILSD